jgi:glutathione synthase/RimK-type ligase-like ATP-grasp enzyme
VDLAVEAARLANFDDVGVDVIMRDGRPMILEFNFKYGRKGARQAGIDLVDVLAQKIIKGEL